MIAKASVDVGKLKSVVERELLDLDFSPVVVRRWEVETGIDAAGDPAVWVWAVLDDADFNTPSRTKIRNEVRDAVARVAGGPSPIAYVRFRMTSEV